MIVVAVEDAASKDIGCISKLNWKTVDERDRAIHRSRGRPVQGRDGLREGPESSLGERTRARSVFVGRGKVTLLHRWQRNEFEGKVLLVRQTLECLSGLRQVRVVVVGEQLSDARKIAALHQLECALVVKTIRSS